jgi:hypothetical protein
VGQNNGWTRREAKEAYFRAGTRFMHIANVNIAMKNPKTTIFP